VRIGYTEGEALDVDDVLVIITMPVDIAEP
jgi:hypothetical protein